MPSLEMLKRDFINVNQHRSCINSGFIMESFVPIKPKDIASYRCKNLEFVMIHKGDAKRATQRKNRSDLIRHRREMESC
jgi:hypothetical protein